MQRDSMTDTINPDDLTMCRAAHQQAVRAEQAMLQAKQGYEQAQQVYLGALGAYRFSAGLALERKGLPPTAGFNLETGEIVRSGANGGSGAAVPPPADANPDARVAIQPPKPFIAPLHARRKKGA